MLGHLDTWNYNSLKEGLINLICLVIRHMLEMLRIKKSPSEDPYSSWREQSEINIYYQFIIHP